MCTFKYCLNVDLLKNEGQRTITLAIPAFKPSVLFSIMMRYYFNSDKAFHLNHELETGVQSIFGLFAMLRIDYWSKLTLLCGFVSRTYPAVKVPRATLRKK